MSRHLSVLMPVYNGQNYLADAVHSILNQTFTDFEFIIVDDGSSDSTPDILRCFARQDSRIRLITIRPNTGYVVALNQALAMASGEFLARMDADDISLPTRFATQLQYLEANPDCVLLGTHVITMDQDGDLIGPMPDIAFGHAAINHALLTRGWPMVHPTVMMRSDAVRKVGGYCVDFSPNEDHDLFLRLAEIGRIENLPQVLFRYRRHSGSVTATQTRLSAMRLDRIVSEACQRRGIPVVPIAPEPPQVQLATQLTDSRDWAWLALKSGNLHTARKYARANLHSHPLSKDSWRLAYCAMRGH